MSNINQKLAERLRVLADIYESSDDLVIPSELSSYSSMTYWVSGPAEATDIVKALRKMGYEWEKRPSYDGQHLILENKNGDPLNVQIWISRSAVCEPVVVGQETKIKKVVKQGAVYEDVEETVDVIEWDCGSVLKAAIAERAAAEVEA